MKTSFFANHYFNQVKEISDLMDKKKLNTLAEQIYLIKKKSGRMFFLGVGGSAGNCSHAVNDFRKLCDFECYTPVDNVSELTARINDEGWNSSFKNWLKISKLNRKDALFILSVGGGNKKKNVSVNLIEAIDYAKKIKSKIFGIVGRKDGYLSVKGNCVIHIPNVDDKLLTPLTEAYQAVVWHFLVSHPLLKKNKTKW